MLTNEYTKEVQIENLFFFSSSSKDASSHQLFIFVYYVLLSTMQAWITGLVRHAIGVVSLTTCSAAGRVMLCCYILKRSRVVV